ncbi:MAG: hypothetical protein HY716_16530 [Planctomycetes bacterium]|nr:hypothetical protein [Planctomycetota bacterium]
MERIRTLHWTWKALFATGAAIAAVVVLYVLGRSIQYVAASRSPVGMFEPQGSDATFRIVEGAKHWRRIQESEFWAVVRGRLLRDAAMRDQINGLLEKVGAPTIDQLTDRRFLDRNALLREESLLRLAGRDLLAAVDFRDSKAAYCVATRVGWSDFLLLPLAQLFPGAVGAEKVDVGGWRALRWGDFYVAPQGAVVVVSNDEAMIRSALRRRGPEKTPEAPLSARMEGTLLRPWLSGFPIGGFLTFTDVSELEACRVTLDVSGSALLVRVEADGMKPWRQDPAPVDLMRFVPANGIGILLSNAKATHLWDWVQTIADPRRPPGTPWDRFARHNLREFVDALNAELLSQDVLSRLSGPTSILVGSSEGENGLTYAALAFYIRAAPGEDPRVAGEALQRKIDEVVRKAKDTLRGDSMQVGGYPVRSYSFDPDILGWNNYLCASYAVTGDALVIANNPAFLAQTLRCGAQQEPAMTNELFFEEALTRLRNLGLDKTIGPDAIASGFFYGPPMREGLEGFFPTLASKTVESFEYRSRLRQELMAKSVKEGRALDPNALDLAVDRVLRERIREMELILRARARFLDYVEWAAYQAEAVPGGMRIAAAMSLK